MEFFATKTYGLDGETRNDLRYNWHVFWVSPVFGFHGWKKEYGGLSFLLLLYLIWSFLTSRRWSITKS